MKQSQTFKFDPDLLEALKKEAARLGVPFNQYAETLLATHPKRQKK